MSRISCLRYYFPIGCAPHVLDRSHTALRMMATRADDEVIEGPSRDEGQVSVETENFENAVSFALSMSAKQ